MTRKRGNLRVTVMKEKMQTSGKRKSDEVKKLLWEKMKKEYQTNRNSKL